LFFDIECTIEPCPYLYPDNIKGQAEFFKELKAAWPAVYTSVYLGGLPGQRVAGVAHPTADTPYCQAGPVCETFVKGLCVKGVDPPDPRLLNCSAAMSSPSHPLGQGCPNCTAPLYYSLDDVRAMVPSVDQFVFGGYGTVDYEYLPEGLTANCAPDLEDPNSCGAVNSWQIINFTLTGGAGGSGKVRPMWSDVIPREKLVYGVGWFNHQASLLGPAGPEDKVYGDSPSFCAAARIAADPSNSNARRRMDDTGTWVLDRADGSNMRLWYDDATSLLPKYRAVRAAGWAGVAMWTANGLFYNDPMVGLYCPDGVRTMWAAIAKAWPALGAAG
jgi:hypothetical protein